MNALGDNGAIEISLESLGHLIFIHFSLPPCLPFSRRRSRIFDIAVGLICARGKKKNAGDLMSMLSSRFRCIRPMTRDNCLLNTGLLSEIIAFDITIIHYFVT